MYEKFTKKYKLSKTLRFGLIPQGKTLENIEKNGILEEDELRAKEAVKVKALADEYHKAFIDRILSSLTLKGVDKYVIAYEAQKEGKDNAAEILSEYAKELREEIASSFAKDKDFAALFTGKMYNDILEDPYNEVYFSPASIWEISIKNSNGRIDLTPERAIEGCRLQGFVELPIASMHCKEIQSLRYPNDKPLHKDPFDRILISQAKSEGLTLLTADRDIENYLEPCIRII